MTAIGALAAVAARGLRIPMDVAVVGCDGLEMGRYLVPPLSTIVQPVAEVCRLGIGLLVRRLEDPSAPPERRSLEAVFVPRASSQRRTAVATE
jgi:LacI family transcriptional regulator